MNPRDLNRAVARATGETVREVTHRGFVLLTAGPMEREPQETDKSDSEHGRPGIQRVRSHDPVFGL